MFISIKTVVIFTSGRGKTSVSSTIFKRARVKCNQVCYTSDFKI
jgi:hypothetical protein